jgi:hypothetical protein
MKQNLKEEIERNKELMGLNINEDFLKTISDLASGTWDKIVDFFGDDEKENEDDETIVNIGNLEKGSEEEKKFLNQIHSSLNVRDISPNSKCNCRLKRLKNTKYFIIHHTAGRGNCDGVMSTLNNRKDENKNPQPLGIQWIVDRDGNLCQSLPLNSVGYHILNSNLGPTNYNSQGVEVSGDNDEDILPVQAVTVLKLVKKLGIQPSQIYGHGEVNPGHKAATEGKTIKEFILKNYNKKDNYDFSMFNKV